VLKKKERRKKLIPVKSVRRKKGARRKTVGLNWRKIYCVVVVTDVIARLESSVEPRNNFFTVNGNDFV